ncbi:uncharacterized protein MELLADRAFT_107067 [Melampsora larici-populina 98AG31]|uniref:Uncharacterized protein n=1 Tax=Melampsora larici-populina (strain 98AG31 / pathotype 3-4-7) TaxID=747676 RepID=F4RNJ9_MELLP|nr:uncharacterized protein MELLADRAFT_107067 [Melampsora larici-populina 98AG31]EGG06082.1 hypothetical protein MELLADRAFT_107067 [Melampsora larici-populina 98AG31]
MTVCICHWNNEICELASQVACLPKDYGDVADISCFFERWSGSWSHPVWFLPDTLLVRAMAGAPGVQTCHSLSAWWFCVQGGACQGIDMLLNCADWELSTDDETGHMRDYIDNVVEGITSLIGGQGNLDMSNMLGTQPILYQCLQGNIGASYRRVKQHKSYVLI